MIEKFIQTFIVLFQFATTFTLMCCIYMLMALLDSDFGIEGIFGLVVFQPILAVICSSITIFLCLVLGLPIRINTSIQAWWVRYFYLAIFGTFVGLVFIFLSLIFKQNVLVMQDEVEIYKAIPNTSLGLIGWFLTAFMVFHIYPPRYITDKFQQLLSFIVEKVKAFF